MARQKPYERFIDIRDFNGVYDQIEKIKQLEKLKEEYAKKGIDIQINRKFNDRLQIVTGYQIKVERRRTRSNSSWSLGATRKKNRDCAVASKEVSQLIKEDERD